jgi:exopolysaccharide biosynthesis polyprenyl glycosylphosphotransferase
LIWFLTFLLLLTLRRGGVRLLVAAGRVPPIRVGLLGRTEAGWRYAHRLPRAGVVPQVLAGAFALPGEPAVPAGVPDLGAPDSMGEIAISQRLDRIAIALPGSRRAEVEDAIRRARMNDLDIDLLPDLGMPFHGGIQVEEVGGLAVVRPRDLPLAGWNGVVKRSIDLLVSGALLIVLAPALLACAIAVRVDSPGPILYRQDRVGRDRRVFAMLKFRSMRHDAEAETGPVWASKDDSRRTRVGTFLRTWSLDELPQLWNVFRGDMSLVGPRPERPTFVQEFFETVPEYHGRHRIKAGLTGWAQVNGLRGNVPIEERTRYDVYYIENWSVWLDLRILLKTARAVFAQRGS